MAAPRTLFDKIWETHLVDRQDDGTCLLYIDLHLVHEVTSPQAFEGLRCAGPTRRSPSPTTTCRPSSAATVFATRSRACRSKPSSAMCANSASPISRSTMPAKASSILSDPSRV